MLYRRTPRNPPTLLLRIVATAGAGTLLGMASCGGETSTANGSLPFVPATQNQEPQGDDDSGPPPGFCQGSNFCGFIAYGVVDAGAPDEEAPSCGGHPCGSVGYIDAEASIDSSVDTPDVSVADVEVHGVVPLPEDAGYDAHHPIGVVVEPPDSGSGITCPPVCGVVIGLGPNPGH